MADSASMASSMGLMLLWGSPEWNSLPAGHVHRWGC